jgi:hypothetical protein
MKIPFSRKTILTFLFVILSLAAIALLLTYIFYPSGLSREGMLAGLGSGFEGF